jgi:hypothetical protein
LYVFKYCFKNNVLFMDSVNDCIGLDEGARNGSNCRACMAPPSTVQVDIGALTGKKDSALDAHGVNNNKKKPPEGGLVCAVKCYLAADTM